MGYPWPGMGHPIQRWGVPLGQGWGTSRVRSTDEVLDTPRSVCLLRSRSRTFLYESFVLYINDDVWTNPFCNKYVWLIIAHDMRFYGGNSIFIIYLFSLFAVLCENLIGFELCSSLGHIPTIHRNWVNAGARTYIFLISSENKVRTLSFTPR